MTLIELLIVVAIIGILISILMPSLHKARDEAKRAVCLSNQRQSVIASTLFVNDKDNAVPYGRGQGAAWQNMYTYYTPTATNHTGLGRLVQEGYVQTSESFYCPAFTWSPHVNNSPDNPLGGPNNISKNTSFAIIYTSPIGKESIFNWNGDQIGSWLKLATISDSAVMVDQFFRTLEKFPRHPRNTFNVAYGDGASKSVVVASELAGFNINSSTDWDKLFLDLLPELR